MKEKFFKSMIFIKKYNFIILLVIFLLLPLGTVLISKYVSKEDANRNAHAFQSTPNSDIPLPSLFRDSKNGNTFSIQLTQGAPDTGKFTFFVPTNGYYRGVLQIKEKINCEEKEDCEEDEEDNNKSKIIHLQDMVAAHFYQLNSSTPIAIMIRIEGKINIKQQSATINLWIKGAHYRLKTAKINSQEAQATAKQVAATLISHKWNELYSLLSSSIQSSITQAQFTNQMNGNSQVTAVSLNGPNQITQVDGYTYSTQPVTVTVHQADGTTGHYISKLFFVWEQGGWKFLSTTTPAQ